MKKILVLHYSQSGQLRQVLDHIIAPLEFDAEVQCDYMQITPVDEYPYPWKFYQFFNVFPESVFLDGCEVQQLPTDKEYDLIILGYTVWFLSPSLPVSGFMQSKQAKKLFADKPVITVIACRDMWLTAQEKMKTMISDVGARLIDNVVFTDQGKSLYSFVTTPRWMLTGKKDPFWFFPPAGVAEKEIEEASRFGIAISSALAEDKEKEVEPLLKDLGAANVNGKLIATEHIAHRSFRIWSRLIQKAGPQNSGGRNVVITIYICFLLTLVVTVVPLNILLRTLLQPFRKEATARAVQFYEQPSGH